MTDASNLPPAQPMTVGIDHIGLTVRHLDDTLRFFIDCLGWKQVGARPEYPAAFVSDGHVVLTLWEVTQQQVRVEFNRKTNVGLHHLALRVASAAALAEVFARVAQWPGVVVESGVELAGRCAGGPLQARRAAAVLDDRWVARRVCVSNGVRFVTPCACGRVHVHG